MAAKWDDAKGIISELDVGLLPEEVEAISKRLFALAVATKPPDWGYAGMLRDIVEGEHDVIVDVFDVYHLLKLWVEKRDETEEMFMRWNAARVAGGDINHN